MIHDNLLRLTAKWEPELHALLRASRVFKTDLVNHHDLPPSQPVDAMLRLASTFVLPYPVITIEDPASSVTLAELMPATGLLKHRRYFTVATPVHGDERAFDHDLETVLGMREMERRYPADTVTITSGWIEVEDVAASRFRLAAGITSARTLAGSFMFDVLGHAQIEDFDLTELISGESQNAMRAIEQIMYFTTLPGFEGWPQAANPARRFLLSKDGGVEAIPGMF